MLRKIADSIFGVNADENNVYRNERCRGTSIITVVVVPGGTIRDILLSLQDQSRLNLRREDVVERRANHCSTSGATREIMAGTGRLVDKATSTADENEHTERIENPSTSSSHQNTSNNLHTMSDVTRQEPNVVGSNETSKNHDTKSMNFVKNKENNGDVDTIKGFDRHTQRILEARNIQKAKQDQHYKNLYPNTKVTCNKITPAQQTSCGRRH